MKRNYKIKSLIALVTLVMMLPMLIVPSSANSAQTQWSGKDEMGVMTTDGENPIIVEHETLTFNINELRDINELPLIGEKTELDSSVTAEYTFYNPSNMEVTTKLAFPFGTVYKNQYDSNSDKYTITVNGKEIEAEIRHTLCHDTFYGNFDLENDLPRLIDDYEYDEFFNEDMTITKYTVELNGFDEKASWVHWSFEINPADYPNTIFYVPEKSITRANPESGYLQIMGVAVFNGKTFDIYVLGEDNGIPDIDFYARSISMSKEDQEIEGKATIKSKESIKFSNFIFEDYDEESGISKLDWYNANIHLYQNSYLEDRYLYYGSINDGGNQKIMAWYYYDITIGAGERVVNSVTAPMIGGTNIAYDPPVHDYTYLLSPASTWKSFGTLDIIISTPYYMTYSNLDGFEKTEGGYELHLEGLPREKDKYKITLSGIVKEEGKYKDLRFKLCEAEDPKSVTEVAPLLVVIIVILAIVFLPLVIIGLIIYGIVYFVKTQRR